MRTQADVAAAVRADRETWRSLVADVGKDRLDEPGPMGEWTFGDMAGHLAGWRNYRASQFEASARGESDPGPPWPAELEEDDDINAWIHERDRVRTAEELVAEYDASFERLAAAIEALPESAVADANAFPWMDGDAIVDADFTSHLHEEHLPAVRAWLDRS